MTTTPTPTAEALKLARDALARALSDDQAYITACTEALAAIDALPASMPTVARHMRVIGCNGSADWCDLGAEQPEMQPGVEAMPLVYAQAAPAPAPMTHAEAAAAIGITSALYRYHRGAPAADVVTPLEAALLALNPTAHAAPAPAPAGQRLEAGEIESLAHRIAWRYKRSGDPQHSDTYTFNRATLLQFADALAARTQAPAAPAVAAPEPLTDWMTPTALQQRMSDAVTLLCAGRRPPDDMVAGWLDTSAEDHRLQEFAIEHGPAWAQGVGLLDAARVMADQPTEGVAHGITAPTTQEPRQ